MLNLLLYRMGCGGRMKNNIFRIIVLFILLMLLSGITCSAESSEPVDIKASVTVPEGSAEIANICIQANNSLGSSYEEILSYRSSTDGGLLTFDNTTYSSLDSIDRRTFMEAALKATTKTGLNARTKNKVYNFIASQDTAVTNAMKYLQVDANADFVEAKKFFDPWSGVVGYVLGVLSVSIFMFSGLSIAFDIGYIVLPGLRLVLNFGDDNKKPFCISKEAFTAVRDTESCEEYKNTLGVYMKRRVGLIIAMSICVGYLISGRLFDMVMYFIDAFSW